MAEMRILIKGTHSLYLQGSKMLPPFQNLKKIVTVYLIGAMLGGAYFFASKLFPVLNSSIVSFSLNLKGPFLLGNPFLLTIAIFVNNVQVAFVACIVPLALAATMGKLGEKSRSFGVPTTLERVIGRLRRNFLSRVYEEMSLGALKRKINRTVPLSCPAVSGLVAAENGAITGVFLAGSWFFHGPSGVWMFAKLLLPHGLIEIPVLLMACAYGLSLSSEPVNLLRNGKKIKAKEKAVEVLEDEKTWKSFLLVVALLGVSAPIEVFLTPAIA